MYKNDLEVDRSYLRNDYMMFTYMFLIPLSLYLDFLVFNMINAKHGVRDVLLILSRIKIYRMEKSEMMSEVPKKANEIISDIKIDLEMLGKKG